MKINSLKIINTIVALSFLIAFTSFGKIEKHYPTDSKLVPYELNYSEIDFSKKIYIRIFKYEGVLQIFIEKNEKYELLKAYAICKYSGELGPKKKHGDMQAPEGYYSIIKHNLNPESKFFKAINVGYPNEFDKGHHYTGSAIMIHGGCRSIGCFAMTDSLIKDIYFIVENVLKYHKVIPVHIFPFYMTEENMVKFKNMKEDDEIKNTINYLLGNEIGLKYEENIGFWEVLKEGFDYFEKKKVPPKILVINKQYVIDKN